jgi:hypothetical protein
VRSEIQQTLPFKARCCSSLTSLRKGASRVIHSQRARHSAHASGSGCNHLSARCGRLQAEGHASITVVWPAVPAHHARRRFPLNASYLQL